MAIIGNNNIEATAVTSFPGRGFGAIGPSDVYTGVAGDTVTELSWYGNRNDVTDLTIDIGIYTVTAGLPDVLVGTVSSLTVNSDTDQWWAVTGLSIALSAGVDYCVCWVARDSHPYQGRRVGLTDGSSQATLGGATLPATWTHFTVFAIRYSVFGLVEAGGGGVFVTPATTADFGLSAISPSVTAPNAVTPATTADFGLSAISPSVTAPNAVTPATTADFGLSAISPSVTAPNAVTPATTADFGLSAISPSITIGGAVNVTPATTADFGLSAISPSITVGGPVNVTPPVATFGLSTVSPQVEDGKSGGGGSPDFFTISVLPLIGESL